MTIKRNGSDLRSDREMSVQFSLLRSDPTWQELSLRRAKKKKRRRAFSRNNAYAADATTLISATAAIMLILARSCADYFLVTRKNANEFISTQRIGEFLYIGLQ